MAFLIDWVTFDGGIVTDVYGRLTRDTVVTYRAYLMEVGSPMVPPSVLTDEQAATLTLKAIVDGTGRPYPVGFGRTVAGGAAVAEKDGIMGHESGLAAISLWRSKADRDAGFRPIGSTRVDLEPGLALNAVFARMEAGDRDGAIAAIYAAAKARMAADPRLAAEFTNLRDA